MKKDKIAFGMLLFLSVVFFSHNALAFYAEFCVKWKANYVDAGYGEDYVSSTGGHLWAARYSHAQLQKRVIYTSSSKDAPSSKASHYWVNVWSGILNWNGCTPDYINIYPGETYRFRQGTKLERIDGRKIYVQHGVAPDFGATWVWLNNYFNTEGLPITGWGTCSFEPSWNSPQTRVTVVAARVLGYYNKLEYPEYTKTYVNTNHVFCNGTYSEQETPGICIDPEYPWVSPILDHSTYKFVIGHEFGHRQADATNGPAGHFLSFMNNKPYYTDFDTDTPHQCNCVHSGDSVCLQARTYIGTAQVEAWAHFYGAALFNKRETNCHMGFWAPIYVPNLFIPPTLSTVSPVHLNCAANPKWMENQCYAEPDHTNRGTMQDWLNFYWNVWANGSHLFSVNEISNVWDGLDPIWGDVEQSPSPYEYLPIGWAWGDLVDKVEGIYGEFNIKTQHFTDTGGFAGVNH